MSRAPLRKRLAFGVTGLLIMTLVIELLLRGVFAVVPMELHYFKYRTSPWLRDDHPEWGPWHHAETSTEHVMRCAEATYTSNAHGMRDRPRAMAKGARPRVAVLGDSFTEGFMVDDDETFAARLEDVEFAGEVEFLNFGSSGNLSTTQYGLIYEHLAKRFSPDAVIVAFLNENDLSENSEEMWTGRFGDGRRRPYLVEDGQTWSVVWRGQGTGQYGTGQYLSNQLMRWSMIARMVNEISLRLKYDDTVRVPSLEVYDTRESEAVAQAWRTTREGLRRLRDAVRGDGGRLVVVQIAEQAQIDPTQRAQISAAEGHDPAHPFSRLEAITRELGVGYHSLVPTFEARRKTLNLKPPYFGKTCDRHWSPLGHALAAEDIADYLVEAGVLNAPTRTVESHAASD